MSNLRDLILAADDLPREELYVPEWKITVFVRTISGTQRDRFEGALAKDPFADVRARLAAYSLCDAEGNALFTEQDVKALGAKSAAALSRVVDVAMRLNAVTPADLDGIEKNSGGIPPA